MAKKAQQKNEPRSLPKWIVWASVGLIVVIAAVVYFVARSSQEANQRLSPTPTIIALPAEISVDDAFFLFGSNNVLFLDVRPATDWNAYHIDKSVSIPSGELPARLSELPRTGVIVIVDETGADLSQQARGILEKAGFSSVTGMLGGMEAWVQRGYPIIGTAPY